MRNRKITNGKKCIDKCFFGLKGVIQPRSQCFLNITVVSEEESEGSFSSFL